MGKYTYWIVALIVAVVALGVGFLLTRVDVIDSAYAADAALVPTVSDQSGVDISSAFVFNFDGDVKASSVRKYLTVEPAMELGIHQGQSSSEVLVAPSEPLQPNTVYRFTLKTDGEDAGWAFQTKNVFGIAGVYPGDQISDVPVNSGIEITFSHRNTIDISPYFQIEPAVEGDFLQHGRTVVFTPKQSLAPDTVYKVTVKAGLPLADTEEKLAEDYTFSFETGNKEGRQSNGLGWELQSASLSFSPQQTPTFTMYSYDDRVNASPKVEMKVYSYASPDAYADALQKKAEEAPDWTYYARLYKMPDVTGLQLALDFDANAISDKYGGYVLSCPAPLPAGYYVVVAEYRDISRSVFFQVSDLTAYLQPAEGQSLFWVHDLADGKPVNNATVTYYKTNKSVKTDKNGVAALEVPSSADKDKNKDKFDYYYQAKNDIYFIKAGERSLVVYDNGYINYRGQSSVNYNWQYLYLDRALYRNSDTLNFWGVFIPRDSAGISPDTLSVRLYASGDDEPLLATEVKLSGGTFMGSVNLPNLPSGWYDIKVYNGDTYLFGNGFSVQDFIKASYELNATVQKQAVFAGDTAVFDLSTIGFEGTPMPNIRITYGFMDLQNKTLTTDDSGEAQLSIPVIQKDTEDQHKRFLSYENLYAYTQTPESGYVYANAYVTVLNSSLGIESEGKIKDNKGEVENYIYTANTDKVNSGASQYWEEGAFDGGPAAGQKASVKTYHLYWIKKPTGDYYYDYINKTKVPNYTYDEKKVLIDQAQIISGTDGKVVYSFDTGKGQAPVTDIAGAVIEDRNSFLVETSVTDAKGRTNTAVAYLYGESGSTNPYSYDDWYYLQADKDAYLQNEYYNVYFKHGEDSLLAEKEGAFLFISAQNGIRDYVVQDKPTYSDKFKAEDVPNTYLTGAYFDGKYYHDAYPISLNADIEQFKLDMDLSFDKEKYAPGDEAVLTVTVKDRDGKPRQAKVNLSLVDEAIFKIMDQYSDLSSLYSGISSGLGSSLVTNSKSMNADGMGGGGGENEAGNSVRDYFPDAIKFLEVQTDKDGKAEIKITLPDNITAWRCTANAITDDIKIATVTKDIDVSLPFFSEAISNSAYLDGDRVTIFLRSSGSMAQGKITYNVQVKHNDTVSEKTVSTEDNALTPVSLGILHTGEYEIVVKSYSKAGGQDSFSHHLSVVDNFHQVNRSSSFDMNDPSTIKGSDTYTTRIVISTPYRNQMIDTLWKNSFSDNLRIESKLASLAAVQLLGEYDDETFGDLLAPDETAISQYQRSDGGIAFLPYADSDLATSVKVASIGGDQFSRNQLASYFESFLEHKENREKQILALAGLASLGEPVLQEINLLMEEKDLNAEEQLYLIWGLLQCGDKQKASAALQSFLDANAQDLGDTMMIKGEDDLTVTASRTMWAAMIAAYCGNIDDFFSLFNYVEKADSQDLLAVEEVLCAEGMLPRLSNNGAYFTYTLEGTSHKVELNGKDDYQITLLPEQLSNISFKSIKGNLSAMSYYKDAPDLSAKDRVSGVVLKRYYSGGSNGVYSTDTVLKVNLYYHLPDYLPEGYYVITDCLPAGVRAIENSPNLLSKVGNYFGSDFTNGQVVTFMVYKEKHKAADDTITYYARPISAGRFTAQSAVLSQGATGEIYQYTVSNAVTIR